ncbi:MAG TPA: M13 family metallopeptidase [Allosphingosinicella sp.]
MPRFAPAFALLFTALAAAAIAAQPAATGKAGVDLAGIDRSVAPGDSFDRYANGAWRERTEMPADRTRIGSFIAVAEVVEGRNREIIAGMAATNPAAGSNERKIADYYAAYLDQDEIDRRGLEPLGPVLRQVRAVANRRDLSAALGASLRADVDPLNATNFWTENLLGLFVTQALQDPGRTVPYLLQGGLGMPDRDYYLSDEADMVRIRTAYRTYIADFLAGIGIADAPARAQRIFDLETKIARAQVGAVDAQNAQAAKTWRRADFAARAPGIDWDAFFDAAQLGDQPEFIAWHPAPIRGLSALVASEPLETWKDWLAFHSASRMAAVLPRRLDDLRFGFYGRTLSGAQAQRPREKRALAATGNALGDAVGRIYVDRYFPASARADVQQMARNITAAFDRRLQTIDWMSPATRAEARRKVSTISVSVGYPDRWRDYAGLEVRPDDAFGNARRAELFEYRHQLAKIGRPVDRGEWWMFPHVVNAVNLPLQNALNFPAGILEPPFYDPNADPAFNYGAIGSVIGHEISHSFDNLGAGFDAEGRLRNWWTPEDLAHFQAAGQALVRQYNAYEPLPGLHLNGELTLGENIADLAGLAAAYDAYHASLNGREPPVIEGLTGDQRFFLAYAQAHRAKAREAALRAQIATNEHAPDPWRAETVRNLDPWYSAFDVQPGQALYLAPSDRVRIW